MGREIVENDPDDIGVRVMEIDEIAHACGKILSGTLFSDLDPAPRSMRVEEDKEINRPIAPVFAIIAFRLAQLGRNWLANLADELMRAFIKAYDGSLWIMPSA